MAQSTGSRPSPRGRPLGRKRQGGATPWWERCRASALCFSVARSCDFIPLSRGCTVESPGPTVGTPSSPSTPLLPLSPSRPAPACLPSPAQHAARGPRVSPHALPAASAVSAVPAVAAAAAASNLWPDHRHPQCPNSAGHPTHTWHSQCPN